MTSVQKAINKSHAIVSVVKKLGKTKSPIALTIKNALTIRLNSLLPATANKKLNQIPNPTTKHKSKLIIFFLLSCICYTYIMPYKGNVQH